MNTIYLFATSHSVRMSLKIFVVRRIRSTRANGVRPSGDNDSRNARSLPDPDASIQALRATAMTGYPSVTRFGGGFGEFRTAR